MSPKKLSFCMIAKDEEQWIGRCLNSVKNVVDEMIVVDTGSSDETARIAASLGAVVLHYPWDGHFANARNYGLQYATGEWILWLDADEELDAIDAPHLREVLDHSQPILFMGLINYYGETPPDPERVYRIAHHRLFRNGLGLQFQGMIHEQLNVEEVLGQLTEMTTVDINIHHYGYLDEVVATKGKMERNLSILIKVVEMPDPDPWVYYHIASEFYRCKSYQEAFQYTNMSIVKFLEKQKAPPAMLYKMKDILIRLGSYSGAWPGIDKIIHIYPDYVDLHYYKGIILKELGRLEEAVETFRHCITLGDGNVRYLSLNGVGSFFAWYLLGCCYEELGQIQAATEAYRQTTTLSPSHQEAIAALARLMGVTDTK